MNPNGRVKIFAATLIAMGSFAGTQAFVAHSTGRGGGSGRAPKPPQEIFRIIDEDARKARFDGTVQGWRLAPSSVLEAEGLGDRNLAPCDATPAGSQTTTQLDFNLTYMPPGINEESVGGPSKWVCGPKGLSVLYNYNITTPYGTGSLLAERAVWGRRSLATFVADDRVEAGTINGRPAIFVHPADDESGLGQAQIVVIEDNVSPEFTILRLVSNEGIPFTELVKIAEGAK